MAQSDVIHGKIFLDPELSRFETDISPWTNPTDWLQKYQHQTNSVVVEIFANFACKPRFEPLKDLGSLVYQVCCSIQEFEHVVSQPAAACVHLCRHASSVLR